MARDFGSDGATFTPVLGKSNSFTRVIVWLSARFREAASELELALSGGALDLNSIHQKLGVVYENLGMDDLARKHREQAKSKK